MCLGLLYQILKTTMCQVVCKNDILEQFLDVLSEIDLFVQIEEENEMVLKLSV